MGDIEVKIQNDAGKGDERAAAAGEGSSERSKERGKKREAETPEEMTKQELIEKLKAAEQKAQENHDLYMRTYAEM